MMRALPLRHAQRDRHTDKHKEIDTSFIGCKQASDRDRDARKQTDTYRDRHTERETVRETQGVDENAARGDSVVCSVVLVFVSASMLS